MKLTLANIKELKRKSDSPLTKRVCNYVIDRWGDYDDKKHIFTDVLHYGCQSGVVGELIYSSDTVRFYKQYRQEINAYFDKIARNGHNIVLIENDGIRELPSAQTVDPETGEIIGEIPEEEMREFDGDIEEPDLADDEPDISAFDTEALAVLDEMFGNEITLR